MLSSLNIKTFEITDIGLTRENNEDVFLALKDYNFFAIADGMGGHNAGEIAAKEATQFLAKSFSNFLKKNSHKLSKEKLIESLLSFFKQTNLCIYEMSLKNQAYRGMGTTLSCIHFHNKHAIYGHVGDSRIYLYRNKHLIQLTTDHSLQNQLIYQGKLTKEDFSLPKWKNVITRAIGTAQSVQPDFHSILMQPDDTFLLCTDGLSNYISHNDLEKHLHNSNSIEQLGKLLVNQAKLNGGRDNITLMIQKILSV